MTDALNGKTILAGADVSGLQWSFARPAADTTTDYTDAAVSMRVFEQDKKGTPLSTTPSLTLSIGSGLSRSTNTASSQVGLLTITASQLSTLLGTAEAKQFGYVWMLEPVGYTELRAFLGGGYDGRFTIAKEGYGGNESVRLSS